MTRSTGLWLRQRRYRGEHQRICAEVTQQRGKEYVGEVEGQ